MASAVHVSHGARRPHGSRKRRAARGEGRRESIRSHGGRETRGRFIYQWQRALCLHSTQTGGVAALFYNSTRWVGRAALGGGCDRGPPAEFLKQPLDGAWCHTKGCADGVHAEDDGSRSDGRLCKPRQRHGGFARLTTRSSARAGPVSPPAVTSAVFDSAPRSTPPTHPVAGGARGRGAAVRGRPRQRPCAGNLATGDAVI